MPYSTLTDWTATLRSRARVEKASEADNSLPDLADVDSAGPQGAGAPRCEHRTHYDRSGSTSHQWPALVSSDRAADCHPGPVPEGASHTRRKRLRSLRGLQECRWP